MTVFEWKPETTPTNEMKQEYIISTFYGLNVLKEWLPRIRKKLSEIDELIEWITFPMSSAECKAAGFDMTARKSLVTYIDSSKEISDIIPDDLFTIRYESDVSSEKGNNFYVVWEGDSDRLPICGMKSFRTGSRNVRKKNAKKINRLLHGMRNALSNKFMLQLLQLPRSISEIVKIDTQDALCRHLITKSVELVEGIAGTLWLRSRDGNDLILQNTYITPDNHQTFGPESPHRINLKETWLSNVIEEAKPRVEVSEESSKPVELEGVNIGITARITLGIPLVFQHYYVGVICIYSPQFYFFLPTDMLAASSFASSAVPYLESFGRLGLLTEIENCTGNVLRAREGMDKWLKSIEEQVGVKPHQQWALLLKDPETEMIESLAEHGNLDLKSFNRLRSVRHHISSDNIHSHIIKANAIEVIKGNDSRFDSFIQQEIKDELDLIRLFMPLREKPTADIHAYELEDKGSNCFKKTYYFNTESDPEIDAIGTLVIRRLGAIITDDEVKAIHETVREHIPELSSLTLRGALLQLAEILRYLSKARKAILRYGKKKDGTPAREAKVGEDCEMDTITETFPMNSSDKEVGSLELIFDANKTPSKLEKRLVRTFLGILGRLLEALRDRRRSSNKGNFLLALSLAIVSFHDTHNIQDFTRQIARIIIRYLFAEAVCFVTGSISHTETLIDEVYRLECDEREKECKACDCISRRTDWPGDFSESLGNLRNQIPEECLDNLSSTAQDDDSLLFREIVNASEVTNSRFLRMFVHLRPIQDAPVEQTHELIEFINVVVASIIKGHWEEESQKAKWMKRFTDMSNLSTGGLEELFDRATNLLRGTSGYVGVVYLGYDDQEDEYFIYNTDKEEDFFIEHQTFTRKFRRMKVDGNDVYSDHNAKVKYLAPQQLKIPPMGYFPFREGLELLVVVPIQHRPLAPNAEMQREQPRADNFLQSSIFNHFVLVRTIGDDNNSEAPFLAALALLLREQVRRIETKEVLEVRTKTEELFQLFSEDKALFEQLYDHVSGISSPCSIAQYEGNSLQRLPQKYKKPDDDTSTFQRLYFLDPAIYDKLLNKDFVRLKRHEIDNLFGNSASNQIQAWIYRLKSGTSYERILVGVHQFQNRDVGILPHKFSCIRQILNVCDPVLRNVKKIEEIKVKAAQVAHAVKSHFGAIYDHADLALVGIMQTPGIETKPEVAINRIFRALDSARDAIMSELDQQGLPEAEINLDTTIRGILVRLQPEAKNRGVELRYAPRLADAPNLSVQGPAFDIILTNLIDNAIKYSWKDHYVWIDVEPLRKSPYKWLVIVQNYGEGIPPDEEKAIYEFQNRGRPRKRRVATEGMGIGLATSKALANKMGMDISHTSSFVGTKESERRDAQRYVTTFRLWIPEDREIASKKGTD